MYGPAATSDLCFVAIQYHQSLSKTKLRHEDAVDTPNREAIGLSRLSSTPSNTLTFSQISQIFAVKITVNQQAHTHEISVRKEDPLVQDHRIGECLR